MWKENMAYDPSKEGPRITVVNGYEIFELPAGGFRVLTSDGPASEDVFATFDLASDYALTLPPGSRR